MTSTFIDIKGSKKDIQPKNGTDFSLEEMQGYVGGYIEIVRLSSTQIMVVNEEGAINGSDLNYMATLIYNMAGGRSPIYGNVIVCPTEMVK